MRQFLLKTVCFALLALVALVPVLLAGVVWWAVHSEREWGRYQARRNAGEEPPLASFIPPPVPDAENFAKLPLFQPLFGPDEARNKAEHDRLRKELSMKELVAEKDRPALPSWATGRRADAARFQNPAFLAALARLEPTLREVAAAARLPYFRFPMLYDADDPQTFLHVSRHLGLLVHLQSDFAYRATAALCAGERDRAFADVETMLRLARSSREEPVLFGRVVDAMLQSLLLNVVWEGLAGRQWSGEQLAVIQPELARLDLLPGARRSVQCEKMAAEAHWLSLFSRLKKSGGLWARGMRALYVDGNLLEANRLYDTYFFPAIDPAAHRVNTELARRGAAEYEAKWKLHRRLCSPQMILSTLSFGTMGGVILQVAHAQSATDQAIVACALERYRQAHGGFPETLAALAPGRFPDVMRRASPISPAASRTTSAPASRSAIAASRTAGLPSGRRG